MARDKLKAGGIISLEEMLEAGLHFGHRRQRWNPKVAPYVFGIREGVHIFDLEKTRDLLLAACEELKERASRGELILLVGTKQQASGIIKATGESLGLPYLSECWIGGLLTNFSQVKKSIEKLSRMKKEREEGEYKKFTKKEQLILDREITTLTRKFGGVANLDRLPDALFIVDVHKESTAVAEARRAGIPIVGVVDTNSDPTIIDYPIPANDDSTKSVEFIMEKIGEAIELGQKSKVEKVDEVAKVDQAVA